MSLRNLPKFSYVLHTSEEFLVYSQLFQVSITSPFIHLCVFASVYILPFYLLYTQISFNIFLLHPSLCVTSLQVDVKEGDFLVTFIFNISDIFNFSTYCLIAITHVDQVPFSLKVRHCTNFFPQSFGQKQDLLVQFSFAWFLVRTLIYQFDI